MIQSISPPVRDKYGDESEEESSSSEEEDDDAEVRYRSK